MSQFNNIFSEFEIPKSEENKNLPSVIHSHINLMRISIFFTWEPEPIKESYSFLVYLPSKVESNGVVIFKNITRNSSANVFVKGKRELKNEYLDAIKDLVNSNSFELAYEGSIGTDGSFANMFDKIGMKVGD